MDGALIGIVIGIIAMMGMIIKTRIPVALAMIIASIIMGLFAGMAPTELINAIKAGFGGGSGWYWPDHRFRRYHGSVF